MPIARRLDFNLEISAMRLMLVVASLVLAATTVIPFSAPAGAQTKLRVVTTVAPITNIALNVGGDLIELAGLVPGGTDSHTFEPSPSDARKLAEADLVVVNGLALEETTIELARANLKSGARLLELGDNTITPDQWVFDFSFPAENGDPNPHVWMNPIYAGRYAELIRDALVELDAANADYYRGNTARFGEKIAELDRMTTVTIATIPEQNRKLLTYHDSFAYFAPRYGLTVIGAIQPADFAEPSAREVAALIEQIKAERVPAIFGSEVFPSPVLEQIGREAGVRFYDELRDDDLPGDESAPEHTYLGMMKFDVQLMAEALGGSPAPLDSFDPRNTFQR
jgi:ABC-type Zn uptake system ZnuABC Zn-binding protein ZnuA